MTHVVRSVDEDEQPLGYNFDLKRFRQNLKLGNFYDGESVKSYEMF